MDEENRLKITLWLKPSIVHQMDGWLEEDNHKSRGEFVEKALQFYMGYLTMEDTSEYLSRALMDTLRGTLTDNGNRLCALLFKLCVGVNVMGHIAAAHSRADPINHRELWAFAVNEVLRANGKISFDDTLDLQR